MSPKILFLVVALTALCGLIQADHLMKRLHKKQMLSSSISDHSTGKNLKNLLRKRRDTENSASSGSSEETLALAKFFISIAWQEEKLDVLTGFLDEISDTDTNITIIGWQRILNEDKQVERINTIQVVIPPKPSSVAVAPSDDDDDDDDDDDEEDERILPHDKINEAKEFFDPMAQLGIPVSLTAEEFDKEGNNELLLYLDKDELYVRAENFAIYNKTATATKEEVSKFIASLKPAAFGKPSVLKYDENNNLLVDQSNIRPQLLGTVLDYYEASDDILVQSPSIIAEVSQKYSHNEIPRQLASRYNKAFPLYKWRVLTDPGNYYITRDVSVTLTYDNFDFDESSDISWVVYGIKVPAASNK